MRIISLSRFFGFLIASLRGARILWLSKRLPQSVCLLAVICGLGCIAAAAEAPAKFKVGEFEFSRPADWEWVDVSSSPMRKAQLKINGPEKSQSAEVVFFHFGAGGAGGVKANVDRWLSQFEESKEKLNSQMEEVIIGKHKVTFVQAEGTYMSGMAGSGRPPVAQPNSMLLGAILESEQGNVFAKMTGANKLVRASRASFQKMIRSALE